MSFTDPTRLPGPILDHRNEITRRQLFGRSFHAAGVGHIASQLLHFGSHLGQGRVIPQPRG